MKTLTGIVVMVIALLISSCGATSKNIDSLVLPTSNKKIDTVQHRSSTYDGCAELVVIQTYDANGLILDSQAARGRTLPCTVVEVGIEAGSRVGSAMIIGEAMVGAAKATRPDNIKVDAVNNNVNSNVNKQGQAQGQLQLQGQQQGQKQGNYWKGGNVTPPGGGGEGHGNNGGGNGSGDGTNPGTGHHHDNGDNN